MVEHRLKSKLIVSAMLRMGDLAGQPGMVLSRGDADAGAILLLLRGRNGLALFTQTRAPDGSPAWLRLSGEAPVDQSAADMIVAKQRGYDSDLWVVEFESPDLTAPFVMPLIAS